MKDLVVWFEIPVNDFIRAKQFYDKLLETNIEAEKIGGV
ncbi:MAG TPA: glyoxalase, partial [Candidatus Cloacimonas sp.]|nr:glyoxalase [Candidatus Cloacimonas sp.]